MVIEGVTRNKSIQTLLLECYCTFKPKWTDVSLRKYLCCETAKHLLRDNNTLQTLTLNSNYNHVISSLDIAEVNAPLTALDIKSQRLYHQQTSSFPQHIKGLHCLILGDIVYPVPLPLLFQCHPNLQQLELSLETAESVIELFTILQSNTTVKALKVETDICDSMGPSLQNMLTLNRAIEYFEIVDMQTKDFTTHTISSTYLSFLTTGLTHNTSVNELSVPIPLSSTNYVEMTALFNVISHKNNLTELKVAFTALNKSFVSRDCTDGNISQIMTQLFYEQGLPFIANLLKSNTTIRLLYILTSADNAFNNYRLNWVELIQHLWQTIFLHPSLYYIEIHFNGQWTDSFLEATLNSEKKTLIDIKQLQPSKHLPMIEIFVTSEYESVKFLDC